MKGVSKCVVEIQEPQDENIERILVFFKPGSAAMQVGRQQEEAEKYVSTLVSWHRAPAWSWKKAGTAALALLAGAALLCALWFLFWT